MRTNRARRPTASRRPPSPRARAERLPLDARIFGSRARLAARIQPHHRPSRPRANATVARDRESRDAFSLFFHARHRAKSPSSRDVPFSSPPDDDRTIDPRRVSRETHDRGLSTDRSRGDATRANPSPSRARRRTRLARPSRSESSPFSALALASRTPARAEPSPTRARVSARGADGDRPTRPTGCVGTRGRGWDGYVLGS